MYDVVDEHEYKDIVNKRRQREDFVVDDDGIGYADDGEEHLAEDRKASRGAADQQAGGTIDQDALKKKARKLNQARQRSAAEGSGNIASFLRQGPGPTKASGGGRGQRALHGSLDLDSLLDGLDAAPISASTSAKQPRKRPAASAGRPRVAPSPAQSASPATETPPPADEPFADQMELPEVEEEDAPTPTKRPVDADADTAAAAVADGPTTAAPAKKRSRFGKPSSTELAPTAAVQAAEQARVEQDAQARAAASPAMASGAPALAEAMTLGEGRCCLVAPPSCNSPPLLNLLVLVLLLPLPVCWQASRLTAGRTGLL